MRYAVRMESGDRSKRLQTAGFLEKKVLGLGPDVFRLIVRKDDTYLGYLTGFFNVPGVFGPYDSEINGHVGIDCSHLVVGAWREFSGRRIPFTNVTGLRYNYPKRGFFRLISDDLYLNSDGHLYDRYDPTTHRLSGEHALKIDSAGVQPGDVILFNYEPNPKRRSWDHAGVLFADSGPDGKPNGRLDGWDLIFNAGPAEASINPLSGPEFVSAAQPTRIAVMRWNDPETNKE